MIHERLTDHQIASAFGDTLSLIYKSKMQELNEDLSDVYIHLDKLDIPQHTDFARWFARETLPSWAKERIKAIVHIQKIRRIKINPNKEELNIEKARNVPIESIYQFVKRGKNVSCPLHSDLNPSASIKYNRLVCFSCGAKMDAIALTMKLNNMSFVDAVKTLSN